MINILIQSLQLEKKNELKHNLHSHNMYSHPSMKNHLIAADFTNSKKLHTFNIQTRKKKTIIFRNIMWLLYDDTPALQSRSQL